MIRKIKIVTTLGISGTIETNVSTLGELKPLLRQREITYDGMKLLVGETKNELSEDVAILPQGDFKLYLVPSKTKSGGIDDSLEEIDVRLKNIEDNISEILSILRNGNNSSAKSAPVVSNQALTFEDMQDLEDIKKLAGNTDWD
jgi:hypothetical protein